VAFVSPPMAPPQKIVFRMQFSGMSPVCQEGTLMDACNIMPQCFGEGESHRTPENCHSSMRDVFRYYHNGHLIDISGKEERLVGFISLYARRFPQAVMMMVYNVCIHKDYRARGLGKRIINEAVEALIDELHLDRSQVILALDVDLRSPTAGDALAAYVRMGFVRWIAPCEGIHNYDFTRAIRDSETLPPMRNNFVALYRSPQKYIQEIYESMDPSKKYPTHFCMYKWYKDSYADLGAMLVAQVSKMDEKSGQKPE
jgi:ribosomal protein S18 acetylase RimI-like enzyme